jgi:hypothetical protein
VQAAHDIATKAAGTEVIMVADSEADIFELMVEGQSLEGRAEWIVRPARTERCDSKRRGG